MSFFGGVFRALGFESEETEVKPKKKVKKVEQKASFNLKKDKIERPDKIDGIKVVYIECMADCEKAIKIFKSDEPVLVNFDYADDKSRALGFIEGAMSTLSGSMTSIEENKLYILLPEGVEIE